MDEINKMTFYYEIFNKTGYIYQISYKTSANIIVGSE